LRNFFASSPKYQFGLIFIDICDSSNGIERFFEVEKYFLDKRKNKNLLNS
jgi:hypothetical protein